MLDWNEDTPRPRTPSPKVGWMLFRVVQNKWKNALKFTFYYVFYYIMYSQNWKMLEN